VFGWNGDEVRGAPLVDVIVPPGYREDYVGGVEHFLATGDDSHLPHRFELQARRRDGGEIPVELSLWPVRIGDRFELNLFLDDISDRKTAEQRLWRYAAQLERSNRDLDQFTAVVSHDLKSPLTVISGYADLLAATAGEALDDRSRQMLDQIRQASDRMGALMDNLLSYARLGADDAPMRPVDTAAALDAARANVEDVIGSTGATIEAGDLPVVIGDEVQVIQVFQNLLTNALKYSVADRRPEIEVTAVRRDGAWEIAVEDNGVGVAPEHRDTIFEMFHRADPSGPAGAGVGLAVCKRIAERHGGGIWVEPRPGGGSRFVITLPATDLPPG
jgi:PAS domain S-box-containing protein